MKKLTTSVLFGTLIISGYGVSAGDMHGLNSGVVNVGNHKVHVSLNGQLNRAMLINEDGHNSNFSSVDNDASSSRFSLNAKAKLDKHLHVGGVWENEYESNSTSEINQFNLDHSGSLVARRLEVFFNHDLYGAMWFGKGHMASDMTSELSFSGTDMISASDNYKMAGGFYFRDESLSDEDFKTAVNTGTGVQVKAAFDNLDGLGLEDRVRYDSPKWNGFTASASIRHRSLWDAALRYEGRFEDIDMKAAFGYADPNTSDVDHIMNGSVAALHRDSGVNVAVSAGRKERSNTSAVKDARFLFFQAGIKRHLNSWGSTNFAVDYMKSKHMVTSKDEGKALGFGVQQEIDAVNASVYAGVRNYSYDSVAKSYDRLNTYMVGAVVRL